jgi:predicted permease
VLGFTAAAALGATLLFGLAPAFGLGRVEPNDALKDQGRTVSGERRIGFRNALVVIQVGLSFALVVGAGLFGRTFSTLTLRPLGFDPSHLLIVRVEALPAGVSPHAKAAFAQRVAEAVASAPGVSRASLSCITPMSEGNTTEAVHLAGVAALPRGQWTTWMNCVAPGWFETYGMRVLAGRDFTPADSAGSERVVVVNQAFVRRFGAGQDVIGQRVVSAKPGGGFDAMIVGVVNDSVYRTVRLGIVPTLYDGTFYGSSFSVTAKITAPRALVERNIADAIGKAAPDLAFRFRDYGDQLRATVVQERLVALMSGFFGALAMLLAALGVYGVTAYSVGRRRAEIAIRMALGANAPRVVWLVLRRVATLIILGAAFGVTVSLWCASFISALLFGVEARDPLTLVTAGVVLVSVGLLAGWLPARRVSRLDPATALRI